MAASANRVVVDDDDNDDDDENSGCQCSVTYFLASWKTTYKIR